MFNVDKSFNRGFMESLVYYMTLQRNDVTVQRNDVTVQRNDVTVQRNKSESGLIPVYPM